MDRYDDDTAEECDQYVIKCVPLEKSNGEFVLKKGVNITEGALNIKKIPTMNNSTPKNTTTYIPVLYTRYSMALVGLVGVMVGFIIRTCF